MLEIGTGTGYNAAILAHLVGNPALVTTVDIDADLVAQARVVIKQVVGDGMNVDVRNGLLGVPEKAPFDCIEVTGAFSEVPIALLDQLAPAGRLLLNVRRNLMNIMLLVSKDTRGNIRGRILPLEANFMMLYTEASPHQCVTVPHAALTPVLHTKASELFPPSNLNYPAFGFFLQCHFPGARQLVYKQFTYLQDEPSGRLIQFEGDEVRGDASLWQEVLGIARLYQQLGLPTCQDFSFRVEQGQQIMVLRERQWLFA